MLREAKSGETLEIPPLALWFQSRLERPAGNLQTGLNSGVSAPSRTWLMELIRSHRTCSTHAEMIAAHRWSSAEQTSRILNWSSSSPRQAWRLARAACPEAPHRSPRRRLKKRTQQDIKMLKRWDTKCVRLFKSVLSDTLNAEEAFASLSHTQSKRNWEEESSHYVTS